MLLILGKKKFGSDLFKKKRVDSPKWVKERAKARSMSTSTSANWGNASLNWKAARPTLRRLPTFGA
jgi:hypothetical protein